MDTPQPKHLYQAVGVVEGTLVQGETNSILNTNAADYSVRVKSSAQRHVIEGTVQRFQVYPKFPQGQLVFLIRRAGMKREPGFTLKGCWIDQVGGRLLVHRNAPKYPTEQPRSFLIPVVWESSSPADGQFWALQAELDHGVLRVTTAQGSFEPPPYWTGELPRHLPHNYPKLKPSYP